MRQNQELDIFNIEKARNLPQVSAQDSQEESDIFKLTQGQAKLLSEASVDLSVEIGSISMSIEDLIDLMPGELFEFRLEKGKLVTLKLGTKTIAEAKFVKKDGNFALEIISVLE